MRRKNVLKDALLKGLPAVVLLGILLCIHGIVFYLYNLEMEPFIYSISISLVALLIYLLITWFKEYKKAKRRQQRLNGIMEACGLSYDQFLQENKEEEFRLEESPSLADLDYDKMISCLEKRISILENEFQINQTDMNDYYTTWVHQVKTPIAVMRMLLTEDTELNRNLSSELFRVEQYVDMALHYIRLDASTNDLVVKEHDLDTLVRASVRKFAPQFIGRKLKLDFQPIDYKFVTDQKWFETIIEQLLSNAIKYTPQGGVTISFGPDKILRISDTGIGISPEDLPRIFEKGYTGKNGRKEQKSSGLGLYLCKKAADKLSIPITAESTPGIGTSFLLHLTQEKTIE